MSGSTQAAISPNEKSGNYVDHFTNLPDDIMAEILSQLPIKDVVRTSSLSKDWKSKWVLISNVNIDVEIFSKLWSHKDIFMEFVDNIIRSVKDLKSFHLSCLCCGDPELDRLTSWISALLKRKIHSLQIRMKGGGRTMMADYDPIDFYSLKYSKVKMPCTFKVHVSNCFASLTKLSFSNVLIRNDHSSLGTVTFTFPLLKELKLKECECKMNLVLINAPLLLMLELVTPEEDGTDHYSIKIVGDKIEKFYIYSNYLVKIIPYGRDTMSYYNIVDFYALGHLIVKMPCTFRVSISNLFERLTKLSFSGIKIRNEHRFSTTLVFTFPVLNELEIEDCEWVNVKLVEFNTPLLTRFEFVTPKAELVDGYSIKIIGASIQKLFLGGSYPVDVVCNNSTVADATLVFRHGVMDDSEEEYAAHVLKILKELSKVKMLEISGRLWGIVRTNQGDPLIGLPVLEKLYIPNSTSGEVLLGLLHAAPFLKYLQLYLPSDHGEREYGDYDEYDHDKADKHVPFCLANCLEEIALDYGYCKKPEFDIVEYLLKNGLCVTRLRVHAYAVLMDDTIDEISKIIEGLTTLKIERVPKI